ncbi:putative RNA-directed DNA polymerase from transposon X-element [Araneus ventricosus]|uniref:Putative RNA-directed DNA polymerase from transposon X-element n=1 Tax=Araneus ventricosus TaxID=182803 RepID=A0A4Y2GP40_ARAVE|nr:putative RNA-directed DNA polymerase from transposon X-element [Araneus ventricosus]
MNNNIGVVVYSWNAKGFFGKITELREFLDCNNPDLVLLQETHMSGLDRYYYANYTFYSNPSRTHFKHRGTGILIKNSIPHHYLPNPLLHHVEATMVIVNFHALTPINLISIYVPPSATIEFTLDIEKLVSYNAATFIAGNYNAKHRHWNCNKANKLGNQLYSFAQNTKINILAPKTPTRFDPRGSTIIDIAITRHLHYASTVNSENELSSDHLPVRETIIQNSTTQFDPQSGADIEMEIQRFTAEYIQAFSDTGKWVSKRTEECSAVIKQQTKIRNKLKKKIAQITQDPRDKNLFNRAQNHLRKLHSEASEKRQREVIENLNPTDGSVWQQAKKISKTYFKMPPLLTDKTIVYRNQEKAEAIADILEQQFQTNDLSPPPTGT